MIICTYDVFLINNTSVVFFLRLYKNYLRSFAETHTKSNVFIESTPNLLKYIIIKRIMQYFMTQILLNYCDICVKTSCTKIRRCTMYCKKKKSTGF